MTENRSSARSGTVRYTQNNSNYCVDVPVSQNAATIDCYLSVVGDKSVVDFKGGTIYLTIDSYTTINGKEDAHSNWSSSKTGCGNVGTTGGRVWVQIPSGTTACNGTVTFTNECGKTASFSYERTGADVKWSDPAENTTKSVSADGITFTAYADTTGLTASDCEVTKNPTSNITVGTPQGNGTGAKAVWVEITVPANTSTDSRSWDITIAPK